MQHRSPRPQQPCEGRQVGQPVLGGLLPAPTPAPSPHGGPPLAAGTLPVHPFPPLLLPAV